MFEFFRSIKSWHARRMREQSYYYWDKGPPVENLRTGLMHDNQDQIDYALEKLRSETKLTLADDQQALSELILRCAQFSSPANLEHLIAFWTGEHTKISSYEGSPVHKVLYNKKYPKKELWEQLLKIFPIDITRRHGITTLADAASLGNLEDIELLIEFGACPVGNLSRDVWPEGINGYYPLAFALFFNDDRNAFQKLLKNASTTRVEEIKLLNQVLFSVCTHALHGGEYPGEKRISDMEYLVSLGASFDYIPDGCGGVGLQSLEISEFRSVLKPLLKIVTKSGYNIAEKPDILVELIECFWRDAPRLIRLLSEYGVNFNIAQEVWHYRAPSHFQPVWFGILKFYYSMPDNWFSVAEELLRCGISLDLIDSEGRDFCDIEVLPGETKLDKYNVLNHLRTLGLSYDRYTEAIADLNNLYPDK